MTNIAQHIVKLGGKDYTQVSGRVLLAHADNTDDLSIVTEVVYEDDEKIRVKAAVTTRKGTFTGHAESYKQRGSPQEKKTPLEVAETSSIGRALGFAGYAIEGGIASADEVDNAQGRDEHQPTPQYRTSPPAQPPAPAPQHSTGNGAPASEKQVKAIYAIARGSHRFGEAQTDAACQKLYGALPHELTKEEASAFIDRLKGVTPGGEQAQAAQQQPEPAVPYHEQAPDWLEG